MVSRSVKNNCDLLISFIDSLEEEHVGKYDPIDNPLRINDFKLPDDFVYFSKWSNGFSLFGTEILGFGNEEFDILKTVLREQNDTNNVMPRFIIPFSPVGNGDFYCFDLKNGLDENGLCPVIYWQWNYSSSENYEIDCNSFVDWLKELIEDSLLDEKE